jgi:hypothetical protein
MEFLHINSSNKNTQQFDKMVNDGKHVFVLIYMEGCGPCNATRPEWTKIENILGQPQQKIKYPGVVVADVDQIVCNNIKHISDLSGFPTMRYISDRGNIVENYENDRSIDAFIKWIDSKHGNFVDNTPHMKTAQGGRRRRRRNSRSMRRTRTRSRTRTKYSHSRKNAGWKRKPRNKRNSDRY